MLRVTQVRLPVTAPMEALPAALAKRLHISVSDLTDWAIERRAIDARKRPDLFFVYTLVAEISGEKAYLRRTLPRGVSRYREARYEFPIVSPEGVRERPIIVGSGPAGLFCAYELAAHGFCPILLERGDPVEERIKRVEHFWKTGQLDPQSNVQFGEGGAGTFSDGKLYTGVRDPDARNREVLRILVAAGASDEILYDAHAHLGTDTLAALVISLRKQIEAWGGTICFRRCVTALHTREGHITGVETATGALYEANAVVLALGHSARDTVRQLAGQGILFVPKPFAVGVRIRHCQEAITAAQYGTPIPTDLGPASYKVHTRTSSGRSVYSFCMCPGGYILNASSDPGHLAINGMSDQARDSGYANSAIVSGVTPEEAAAFLGDSADPVFAGMRFQEACEEAAFQAASGAIPVQTFADFRNGTAKRLCAEQRMDGCRGAVAPANVRSLLPPDIGAALEEGILQFGEQIHGFADPQTPLFGIESRTSSPVRLPRDESGQHALRGLFPCGEGAGYAGGIISAAIDGIRTAEAVAAFLCNRKSAYTRS